MTSTLCPYCRKFISPTTGCKRHPPGWTPDHPLPPPVDLAPRKVKASDVRYKQAQARKAQVIVDVRMGYTIVSAVARAGISMSAYSKWRERDRQFVRELESAKAESARTNWEQIESENRPLTTAEFFSVYFGLPPKDFHIEAIEAMENTPLGHITMVQFPPDHAKTTLFENYANMKLALNPQWRFLVGSESLDIAQKILGRIRRRMEVHGPAPQYVARFGPFAPQTGEGRRPSQPWTDDRFNVYKKSDHDERNFSMEAVSVDRSIVSARTDHLHLDDLQSTKTLGRTAKIMHWLRQDALSRPGNHGITTIFNTKAGDGDIFEMLEDDEQLHGILHIVRFPAIIHDPLTLEPRPLWPERFTLEDLDKIRRVRGNEVFERQYMMSRGAGEGTFTFQRPDVERARDGELSMHTPISAGSMCIVGLDPNLGSGKNCVGLAECSPDGKLVFRRWWETTGLQANAQVIAQVRLAVEYAASSGAVVTDVIIEKNNFQSGLMFEETLTELQREFGFNVRPHNTGMNKYDDEVGVASMATSFVRDEIVTPWASDDLTRHWTGEFERQLMSWKPNVSARANGRFKGSILRQDMVMVAWFMWIWWRKNHKTFQTLKTSRASWKRQGVPWKPTGTGLLVPTGR